MKPLTKLKLAVILPLTLLLTSCAGLTFPTGPSASKSYTAADIARMYPPILMHDGDQLTRGTACQIIEHNVTYWCSNEASRPVGFPARLCELGVKVCDEVLGRSAPSNTLQAPPEA